jgi:hypothetical protein
MINWNGIFIKTREQLEVAISNLSEGDKQSLRNEFDGIVAQTFKTQTEKDYEKYMKRAAVKDKIIAEMATENMARVRAGVWTVPNLVALTQDPELKLILDDINTLSFELAVLKLMALTNPLITQKIKNDWVLKLQSHFYNG